LKLNAWTGKAGASGGMSDDALPWILGGRVSFEQFLAPEPEADLKDWKDHRVGWGLILPERPGMSDADLLSNSDAPQPIRDLLAHRGDAPVFRFRPKAADVYNLLRNYKAGKDVTISGSPRGTADDALPYYLLIYGSPAEVPWQLQYILNTNHCVGRLDLMGDALANYVNALMSDWAGMLVEPNHTVVWATDYGGGDITNLMRNSIAEPVYKKLAADTDMEAKFLDGSQASTDNLIKALAAAKPSLVVATSHGMTGPLDKADQMTANLGLPVDCGYHLLEPSALLGQWDPAGAIWYAHACCSAGSDSRSSFTGLVSKDSEAARVLAALAKDVGARVAPLPAALLGAKRPLRAFIGHVEPTFDWTLTQPLTGQYLTDPICRALYDGLYNRQPVGYAFRPWYERIGGLFAEHDAAFQDYKEGQDTQDRLLYYLLSARDVGSAVILGDPTAALPALKPKPAGAK
jgi:hypothetical protein